MGTLTPSAVYERSDQFEIPTAIHKATPLGHVRLRALPLSYRGRFLPGLGSHVTALENNSLISGNIDPRIRVRLPGIHNVYSQTIGKHRTADSPV
ncbi:hypothetical protein BaRGS_00001199 [Batillaria attramentaria]|uniref:Uncharacterized protein n=1 Tax=Batillaria attramentaria TaxID=370345 RepID=A0ABD0M7B0_9CAEN